MTKRVTSDQLLDRVERLEVRVTINEKTLAWLRRRLSSLLPERHYCPHCQAVIHKAAKSCGACGRSWGKPDDPKAGLPY